MDGVLGIGDPYFFGLRIFGDSGEGCTAGESCRADELVGLGIDGADRVEVFDNDGFSVCGEKHVDGSSGHFETVAG